MIKRSLIALFAVGILTVAYVQPAQAHVLATDGDQGAVLHILPDDDPTAGVTTTYELAFSGAKNFNLSDCGCTVSYTLNDAIVDTETIHPVAATTSSNQYTFKKPGVYELVVEGVPKNGADFQAFSLNYSVRVKTANDVNAQPFPITLGVGFALLVVLLLLVAMKADGMLEQRTD